MATTQFDRDSLARWYAGEHLKTDPGIGSIYFLPNGADEREIRFVEINRMIPDQTDDALEPIDFGIDTGSENAHRLVVLDVTPTQWNRIETGRLSLPLGWLLDGKVHYSK